MYMVTPFCWPPSIELIMFPLLLLILILLLVPAVFVLQRKVKQQRREQLMQSPPPGHWFGTLKKTLPMVKKLSSNHWKQLAGLMQVFLAEKKFEGCGGLEVTEEMKVTVAAQACMLLLGRNAQVYPRLKTVLLYPHTYTDGEAARLGESWNTGAVVLSWDSVKGGARNFKDGHNVTFHEFAHQLDQEDGVADGVPILGENNAYQTWARVFRHEFEHLVEETDRGHKDVMDAYGATNPAEFFAVVTETFFEKPRQLKNKHPELFERLRNYYKVDPEEWI
ncbi:zinc-dependent peptidase [Pontiella sp.]|uniref:M90 family metallopeptidase n=1 Tax=Pontiella sp. TaxID=2837462 RepID=UPI0035697655